MALRVDEANDLAVPLEVMPYNFKTEVRGVTVCSLEAKSFDSRRII